MMQIAQKLKDDHRKVAKMLKDLQKTGDGAEKTRADLCRRLVTELRAHSRFEEEVFYPAVREAGAREDVDEALGEHKEVDRMLDRLESMDVASEEFLELVAELEEAVEEHVEHEEEDILPKADESLDDKDLEQMAHTHDEMRRAFMQSGAGGH